MKVTTTKKFDKKFKKQPKKIQKEFEKRIGVFFNDVNDPVLNTYKLAGRLKGLWSFNVSGDVRVIFDMNYKNVIILISIGTHSELY